MKYIKRTTIEQIRKSHDLVIGWENSIVEFEHLYNPFFYEFDGFINDRSENIGEMVCSHLIKIPFYLEGLKGKKVCFVIYPNLEIDCIN